MSDSKNGFHMTDAGGYYKVMYNFNQVGDIKQNQYVEGEWIFTADWNGSWWSANSIAEAKKIARRELKAAFKKHNLK